MVEVYTPSTHDFEVRWLECHGVMNGEIFQANAFESCGDPGEQLMHFARLVPRVEEKGNFKISKNYWNFDNEPVKIKFDNDLFPLPKLGYINHDFYTLYFERKHKKSSPSRYRRGLRIDTIDIVNPCFRELEIMYPELLMGQHDTFIRSFYDLYFPTFFSPEEALNQVKEYKRLGAAINSSVAIILNSGENCITLMKNNWRVADYCPVRDLFVERSSLFSEELSSLGFRFARPE